MPNISSSMIANRQRDYCNWIYMNIPNIDINEMWILFIKYNYNIDNVMESIKNFYSEKIMDDLWFIWENFENNELDNIFYERNTNYQSLTLRHTKLLLILIEVKGVEIIM